MFISAGLIYCYSRSDYQWTPHSKTQRQNTLIFTSCTLRHAHLRHIQERLDESLISKQYLGKRWTLHVVVSIFSYILWYFFIWNDIVIWTWMFPLFPDRYRLLVVSTMSQSFAPEWQCAMWKEQYWAFCYIIPCRICKYFNVSIFPPLIVALLNRSEDAFLTEYGWSIHLQDKNCWMHTWQERRSVTVR